MNIFSSLKTYTGKWAVKARRAFDAEEVAAIERAEVVASQYGNSVCFFMKAGTKAYIPLAQDSELAIGDIVDINKAELLTLTKSGESDIYRVSI